MKIYILLALLVALTSADQLVKDDNNMEFTDKDWENLQ